MDQISYYKEENKMLKTTSKDRVHATAEHVNGGAGFIMKEELITPEQRGEYCRLMNEITLKPNCEIGHHEHHGEAEMYYILKGEGMYEEDGKAIDVAAGDVTFCEDGHGHGLKNNGKEDLVMLAVILKR